MSSKRSAGFQLTRFEHESERPGVEIEEAQQASEDVMVRRKIAPRPKPRGAIGSTSGPATANPFGGFGANSTAPAAPASNPFATFGTTAPSQATPLAPLAPLAPSATPAKPTRIQFIGLNSKFAQTIAHYLEVNPGGSWEAACEKYLAYVKNFSAPPSTVSTPSQKQERPASTSVAPGGSSSSGPSGTNSSNNGPVKFNPPTNFTFGAPAQSSGSSSSGPVKFEPPKTFTFGGQQPKSQEEAKPKEEAPKFKFNSEAPKFESKTSTDDSKPKTDGAPKPFTFGEPTSAVKLNFGETKPAGSGSGSNSGSGFSFGSGTSNLMFGANSAKPDTQQSDTKPFSFSANAGSGSDNKPFSFNAKPNDSAAPKFTFESSNGNSNGASEAPKFSFGNSTPKFSFGQPTNSSANVNSTWKPSEKPAAPAEPEQDDEDAVPAEPQQDFTGKGAGEENEDSVFEVRTKLYELNNEVYGVGLLRVLVHHDTKKARIVLRAHGTGRVLINTSVQKAFTYTATKNFVTIPVFGGEKPVSYRAKVKTEESAKELAEKLNQVA